MLVTGGAFINMRVDTAWMGQVVQSMLVDGIETWAPRLPHKRAVIDFSSPNVAKEMHVGHLRSTILGDTLARTLEYCGLEVVRLNHVVSSSPQPFWACGASRCQLMVALKIAGDLLLLSTQTVAVTPLCCIFGAKAKRGKPYFPTCQRRLLLVL